MKRHVLILPPAIALAITSMLHAAAPASTSSEQARDDAAPINYTVYWENDGGWLKRNHIEDRHYTNGVAITIDHQPGWADRLADGMFDAESFAATRTGVGYVFGQLMFTPQHIESPLLIEDDRPYAGYLYGGLYVERANDTTLDHFELNLGVVGPSSQAEHTQEIIHEWVGGVDPQGWDHQLHDEPAVQIYLRRKWRFDLAPVELEDRQIEAQLIPQVGMALGTVYRHLDAAAMFRMGVNLPDDFGPGRIADLRSAVGHPGRGWSIYGFVGVGGRVVEHNIFLEGNTWQDSPGVEEERLVGRGQAGVSLGYRGERWAGELVYSQTALTEQFEGQAGGDQYATLRLSLIGKF